MAEPTEHIRESLRAIGLTGANDYSAMTRKGLINVHSKYGLRLMVERRDLLVAAGLHISLVAASDGKATAAIVSIANEDRPAGFFAVIMRDGKAIAERPLTWEGDIKGRGRRGPKRGPKTPTRVHDVAPPTPAPRAPVAGREMGANNAASGSPARARARAREVRSTKRACRELARWMKRGNRLHGENGPRIWAILSDSAGSRGQARLRLPDKSMARRLRTEVETYLRYHSADSPAYSAVVALERRLRNDLDPNAVGSPASIQNPAAQAGKQRPQRAKREVAAMATRARAGKKVGSKTGKSQTQGKGKTRATEEETEESTRRRITPEIAQEASDMRDDGATWVEVEEAIGFNGAQLRPHIAKLTGAKIKGLKATPESVAQFREEGYAWYAMATSLGLSIPEVRELAEEGGADVEGRIYAGSDEEDDDEQEEAPKAKRGAKKGAAKPAARKRGKKAADPSEED